MTRSEFQTLQHGVFQVFWKSGGLSVAAVGSTANGERWLAPANWDLPLLPECEHYDDHIANIERVRPIWV